MRVDRYVEERLNLKASNRLLKFAVVVIGLAVLIQGIFTYAALNYQRVVLVPPGLSEEVWIRGSSASDEYLRHMGRYLALLLLHWTPSSAEEQFSEFLSHVDPAVYPEVKAELSDLLDEIRTLSITSSFHIQELVLDPRKRQLEVKGILTQYAGQTKSNEEQVVLRFGFSLVHGRLRIHEVERTSLRGA